MDIGELKNNKHLKALTTATLLLIVSVSAVSLYQHFNSDELLIETENGETVEATVFLDDKEIGFSNSGAIRTTEEQVRNSNTLRIEGEENNLEFEREYSAEQIHFSEEQMSIQIPEKDIGTHKIDFVIEPAREELNGQIYSEGQKLGNTANGTIHIKPEKIGEKVNLKGEWQDSEFELEFEYTSQERDSEEIEYYTEESTLERITFEPKDLDLSKVEEKTLDYINDVRRGEEVPEPEIRSDEELEEPSLEDFDFEEIPDYDLDITQLEPIDPEEDFVSFSESTNLEMDEELRNFARYKSKDMLDREYFAHEDLDGRNHRDHLREREIPFAVAGENLYTIGDIPYYWDEDDLARQTVLGWMDSPAHRSLVEDMDNMYTDAGVGVECGEEYCYMTFVPAQQSAVVDDELQRDYCLADIFYDKAWGYNYGIDVKTEFRVDGNLEVDFVEDANAAFDDCINNNRIDSYEKFRGEDSFEYNHSGAEPGYGIVMYASRDTEFSYKVTYN